MRVSGEMGVGERENVKWDTKESFKRWRPSIEVALLVTPSFPSERQ